MEEDEQEEDQQQQLVDRFDDDDEQLVEQEQRGNDDDDADEDNDEREHRRRIQRLCTLLRNNQLTNLFWDGLGNIPKPVLDALVVNKKKQNKSADDDDDDDDDDDEVCTLKWLYLNSAFKQQHLTLEEAPTDHGDDDHLFHFFATTVLEGHPSIERLILCQNMLNDINLNCLSDTLSYRPPPNLVELDLSNNHHIRNAGIVSLVSGVRHGNINTLEKLTLDNNAFGDEGCMALASLLCVGTLPLHKLAVGNNQIGTRGCEALAAGLKDKNCSLQYLQLCDNKVGDGGAIALAGYLGDEESHLLSLNLDYNEITDKGTCELANSLQRNKRLKDLFLRGNRITSDGSCQAIAAMLRQNTALEALCLPENYLQQINNSNPLLDGEVLLTSALLDCNYSLDTLPSSADFVHLQRICNDNQQIKQEYDQFMEEKSLIDLSVWPKALELTCINSKAGLIYGVLRDRPDEWMLYM